MSETRILFLVGLSMLAGCATQYYEREYYRPDTTSEQTKRDLEECGRAAHRETRAFYSPWGVMDAISTKAQMCMLNRGYKWKEQG